MPPHRRSRGIRGWSLVIFVLAANVAYQGTRYLWRPRTDAGASAGHQRDEIHGIHDRHHDHGGLHRHEHGARGGFHDNVGFHHDENVEVIEEVVYEDVVVEDEAHRGGSSSSTGHSSSRHPEPSGIHVMATSNGSPYQNWQTRIMYRTFLDAQKGSDMKHFTRLLHRRTDDELMGEVPTVRVD